MGTWAVEHVPNLTEVFRHVCTPRYLINVDRSCFFASSLDDYLAKLYFIRVFDFEVFSQLRPHSIRVDCFERLTTAWF